MLRRQEDPLLLQQGHPKPARYQALAFENLLLSLIKALLWHANWQTLGLDGSRVRQE